MPMSGAGSYRLNINNIRLINWSTKQRSAAGCLSRLNPSESGSACPRNKKHNKQQGRGNITGGREVPISRRQFVSAAAGAGIASVVAPRMTLAQNSGPIRIGLLAAKTGPLASGGIDMELELTMFLKERDSTLAGRKVELIVADTAGVPATARTKAQELIEKNNVHCVIGPLAAFEALAIADYLTEKEVPTLGVAAAEDMTQRHPSPWFVRLTSTSAQCAYPLAEYSAKELKYKEIVTIADDFAYGHEMCAGFQRAFEDNGGKIIQKIFTPLATPDYGGYVGQGKKADAIFLCTAGSNSVPFLRPFIEYGLQDQNYLIAGSTVLDASRLVS